MGYMLPIEQMDSGEVARMKINNSFNNLVAQFKNSIPYIQNGYRYVNGENTGVPVSNGNLALRVNNGVLQWKNSDSSMEWANLLKLSDLKGEDGQDGIGLYGSNITDVETSLDEDRGITYLIIHLDDGTSRKVELFKRTDIYPQRQIETGSVENVYRTIFVKSTDTAGTINRTAVVINPDSLQANGETYTPRIGDQIMVYFSTDCKVDDPTLNINGLGAFPIQVRNLTRGNSDGLRKYYFNFHIGAGTRVPMRYLGNSQYYTDFISQVVDVYEGEVWGLVDAIRELSRTRVDVTADEYNQLSQSGQLKQRVYYHIID